MIGNAFCFNQVSLRYFADGGRGGWVASLPFIDEGFASDDSDTRSISTEGEITTRYIVGDATDGTSGAVIALEVILKDAERLGFNKLSNNRPIIFISNGEDRELNIEGTPVEDIPASDIAALRDWVQEHNFDLYGAR